MADDRAPAGGMKQRQDEEGETDLASRSVQVETKRFYLDVKQNRRGKFLKISELGSSGQRNRVSMSMTVANELNGKLPQFVDCQPSPANGDQDANANIKSDSIVKDNRRYYLDLRANQRGTYLRIAQQVAATGQRSQIVLPAEGIAELNQKLTELIEECGADDGEDNSEQLPESRSLRVDNKTFYFDIGSNQRGTYLRVSEVRPTIRTAITVPQAGWERLRDILNELISQSATTDNADTEPADN